ncbi:SDR family NAD(P)-dependent oxidoreductase [Falsiroseomonas stagni]|uniref:NAD(P)-dependent dehydrogenase, short-chain alcohol dehydrogenase family n=1 Tax=Falsiroseomonas stagni DSM 19981 TaxID=1123062 RepID=A0A1I4ANB6_9PROT|nr:SDR family oxidoreductase [Falsiroseomonas stagni]SFK58012.1 NAD(P)-dependent dehydrogenase, short-chain alcohol dehydrogenase family [Falsiroseomonas stagni DSM 19981]
MLPTTPSFRLDGLRALVTGASKGIGRAGAVALAAAGAEVVAAARSLDELEALTTELGEAGLAARAAQLDVTDRTAVRALVEAAGPFDILLNNAGTNIRQPFLSVEDGALDALLDLNLRAMFTVAQAVAQGIAEAGRGGAIINLSSVNGHVAGLNRSVYTATKHGIEGLTKAMAVELGPKGIRVNTIAPGFVDTPLTAGFLADEKVRQAQIRRTPLGRIMTVEDIMGAIVFLASPASAMVSGTCLLIDGGFCAQ